LSVLLSKHLFFVFCCTWLDIGAWAVFVISFGFSMSCLWKLRQLLFSVLRSLHRTQHWVVKCLISCVPIPGVVWAGVLISGAVVFMGLLLTFLFSLACC